MIYYEIQENFNWDYSELRLDLWHNVDKKEWNGNYDTFYDYNNEMKNYKCNKWFYYATEI